MGLRAAASAILKCIGARLCTPAGSLVMGAALFLDATSVSDTSPIANAIFSGGRTHCFFPRIMCVRADPGGFVECDQDDPNLALQVWINHRVRQRGLWAPTTQECDTRLVEQPISGRLPTLSEHSKLRADYARWATRTYNLPPDNWFVTMARIPEGTVLTPITAGYVHNAISTTAAACFLCSFAWISRRAAEARRDRRRAGGLCGDCGYELAGLSGVVCPECGKPIQGSPPSPQTNRAATQ
jgi:hypothetical protein